MTIRLFIGCSGNDEDLETMAALHYSLERHATEDIDITWMRLSRDPKSFWYSDPQKKAGWRTDGWATPFSALRWGIPAACNFEGRAMYMDLDMLALADIAELYYQEFDTPMLSRAEAICVTVYDCAKMQRVLPEINMLKTTPHMYRDVRRKMISDPTIITHYKGGNWNCLDMSKEGRKGEYSSVDDPDIKILHFTQIPTQPHLPYALTRLENEGGKHWYRHPIKQHHRKDAVALFDRMLEGALSSGYTLDKYRSPKFGDYGRGV